MKALKKIAAWLVMMMLILHSGFVSVLAESVEGDPKPSENSEGKEYLASGKNSIAAVRLFDDSYIDQAKYEWIEIFRGTVADQ